MTSFAALASRASRWIGQALVASALLASPAFGQQSLTLPAEAGYGSVANLSCTSGTISVSSATYGANLSWIPAGNVTTQLAQACNGLTSCAYPVYYYVLGDPAPGYAKSYVATWSCSGGGACQISPAGANNINAYYAGVYDYYCTLYGTAYCQAAASYAAAFGGHVLATGSGSCSNAGLYDYYCRVYEYYGYGWDYGGYCSLANSSAVSGQCTGNCGGGTCTPAVSCASAGKNCGTIDDGCSGTLNCGSCSAPQTCGGAGTANVCGCTPTVSCASAGKNCGTITDNCGNTLTCGTCGGGQTCQNNVCVAASQIPGGSYSSMYSCNTNAQNALLGQGGIERCMGLTGPNCDGLGNLPQGWTCDALRHDISPKTNASGPICIATSEPGFSSHGCCGVFADAETSYFGSGGTTSETSLFVNPAMGDYVDSASGQHICNLDTTSSVIWNGSTYIGNPLYGRSCVTPAQYCAYVGPASPSPSLSFPYGSQIKTGPDYTTATGQTLLVGPAGGETRLQDFPAYLSSDINNKPYDARIFSLSQVSRIKMGINALASGVVVLRIGPDSKLCQDHSPGYNLANPSTLNPTWCTISGLYSLAQGSDQSALLDAVDQVANSAGCTPVNGTSGTGGNCRDLPFYHKARGHSFGWYDASYVQPGLYGMLLTSVRYQPWWVALGTYWIYSVAGHATADTYIYQGNGAFQTAPPSGGSPPSGTLSPSATTCVVNPGTGVCSVTVGWSTAGTVQNASVWVTAASTGNHQLWNEGLFGSDTAPWIGTDPITFELFVGNQYGGQLLASVTVRGTNPISCDECHTPDATGTYCVNKVDGTACSAGACYAGTCCNASCAGRICGQTNGCGQVCYAGSGCTGTPSITGEQLAYSPWTANVAALNNYISIWGNNFCSSPQVYINGVWEYAYLAGTNQINAFVYSNTPAGGQYVYVVCNGQWSNGWYVNIGGGAVCGNGVCEAGENGASCGQDCCDYYTACGTTQAGSGGTRWCRSFNYGAYQWVPQAYCGTYQYPYGTQSTCGYGTQYYCCSSINNWTTSYCAY